MSLTELDSRAKVFPLHRKVARFIGTALVVVSCVTTTKAATAEI